MSQEWGRAADAGVWPGRNPVWTLGLLLIAVLSGVAISARGYIREWTPFFVILERTSFGTTGYNGNRHGRREERHYRRGRLGASLP